MSSGKKQKHQKVTMEQPYGVYKIHNEKPGTVARSKILFLRLFLREFLPFRFRNKKRYLKTPKLRAKFQWGEFWKHL